MSSTAGSGPTVVFESALSCPCTEWAWILRSLDGRVPYLAYDRPGNGWSSQHKPAVTSADLNLLTKRLLHELGLSGPYLLVGHSVGGLLARTFARNHAADLAGIVLVDSSHPDQLRRSTLQREGMPLVKQGISRMHLRSRYRLLPEANPDDFGAIADLPADLVEPSGRIMRRPEPWAAARREFALWNTEWAPQAASTLLPEALPIGVVTAGQQASMDLAHGRMQAELAELSTVSMHKVVPNAEHDGLVMNEDQARNVTSVIEWALERHANRVPTGP
ncbi:alpha/beta hydrolase [Amycolatopsis antarctica]|uniref:Alpha/beta hydrolase n=2 Tax=Amycolatopsis antarctica TaxID=1854586 RepID=A0A263D606_9PSEU|nr:alpha/beta hydrolase [Amycolatopsis antarctica]